ncbi:MAG: hypothetical protein KY476_05660 [Planctomycetes bacterium]|nr:hypothetical protein [Planctomycetota bacterium]
MHQARQQTSAPASDAREWESPFDADGTDSPKPYERAADMQPFHDEYIPTPDEIRAECALIQAGWSERERWRRAGFADGYPGWEVPTHHLQRAC